VLAPYSLVFYNEKQEDYYTMEGQSTLKLKGERSKLKGKDPFLSPFTFEL